jgi:predicted RNA-binding protein with PIN domain
MMTLTASLAFLNLHDAFMSIHIIIDGYNLIRQSRSLSDFDQLNIQRGREALLESLDDYRRVRKHQMTVVFDGAGAPSFSTPTDQFRGIEIKFSRSGESADTVIKKMSDRLKEKALVVSSDRDIIDHVVLQGAATISSQYFYKIIGNASHNINDRDAIEDEKGWIPTTKKKGPKRRLSKSARRSRLKIQKL